VSVVPATSPVVLPVALPDLPDVADHAIAGRAIVPAVWLVELVVKTVAEHQGWPTPLPLPVTLSDVAFPRFLPVPDVPRCSFEVALAPTQHGLRASLRSSIALPNGLRRTREHAQMTFVAAAVAPPLPPAPACDFELPAERVYRELITFGPRYCNLRETLRLGPGGAVGIVRSPGPSPEPPPLADCPYLVDSAMHLACVWGQRHAGIIAYPTGFAARVLVRPTTSGERRCTVVPRTVEPRRLVFDLWLCDEDGTVCDTIVGLSMSPIAGGTPPPAWITLTQESA
jgi:hypothetical protein